jgi:hypothetical protein
MAQDQKRKQEIKRQRNDPEYKDGNYTTQLTKLEHQPIDAAECKIALEDQTDPVSFLFDN